MYLIDRAEDVARDFHPSNRNDMLRRQSAFVFYFLNTVARTVVLCLIDFKLPDWLTSII